MFRRAETAGWCFPRSLHATSTPSHDEIQRRAPELWEQRGRPEGHDAEFSQRDAPVSRTCETAVAALEQARLLNDQGLRDVLIDADGQEYAPADFNRLFVEPGLADAHE
jgi:hypothetical protein